MHWLKRIGLFFIGALVLLAIFILLRFVVPFLSSRSHDPITIILPFNDDNLVFVNPMGEKVNHPDAPRGHPGIDFAWDHNVDIIASAAGKVSNIKPHQGFAKGSWDVEIVTGDYAVRYTELSDYAVTQGSFVQQGQLVGHPYLSGQGKQSYAIHWEFDYNTFWTDRLCPLNYFNADSRQRIDAIWVKVGNTFNSQYPSLCSGDYLGKDK